MGSIGQYLRTIGHNRGLGLDIFEVRCGKDYRRADFNLSEGCFCDKYVILYVFLITCIWHTMRHAGRSGRLLTGVRELKTGPRARGPAQGPRPRAPGPPGLRAIHWNVMAGGLDDLGWALAQGPGPRALGPASGFLKDVVSLGLDDNFCGLIVGGSF